LKLLNQGEFKLITFFYIQCQGSEANEKEYVGECEKPRLRRNCDWKLRPLSELRPDVQDDRQVIDEQQEKEIWIDPGMKAHPVAHWDGLDDEEEDIEYTDKRMILGTLNIKKLTPLLY
jgi:hypothetical protein